MPSVSEWLQLYQQQTGKNCNIIKALYGLMILAMLFYNKLKNDLIKNGFKLNSYDPFVANKMANGNQLTLSWHADDLKVSHTLLPL